MAKERKLTPKEQERKIKFEKLEETLKEQGYIQKSLTMSALSANASIILTFPVILIFILVFLTTHSENLLRLNTNEWLTVWGSSIVLIPVHELIHGITWAGFVKDGWKSISFGFNLSALAPYCTCNEPLNKKGYIIGAVMPTLVLGIIPAVISVIAGSRLLLFISIIMIVSGGGDLGVILKILRYKSEAKEVLYIDHPYDIGGVIFEK